MTNIKDYIIVHVWARISIIMCLYLDNFLIFSST